MTDINAQAIEYGRGWVYITHNHNVNVYSIEEERRVREYMRDQGYTLQHITDVPPTSRKAAGWCLCYARYKTCLDTNLGDPVMVEKRYEVKDA